MRLVDQQQAVLVDSASSVDTQDVARNVLSRVYDQLSHVATERPGVKIFFEDERARTVFMLHLQQIIDKQAHNPTLAVVLDRLAAPLEPVTEWIDHEVHPKKQVE